MVTVTKRKIKKATLLKPRESFCLYKHYLEKVDVMIVNNSESNIYLKVKR
jgi:hypothetical protein